MAPTRREQAGRRIPTETTLAAVLALLVDAREKRVAEDKDAVKTELLLARAGVAPEDISALTGKSYDAVRKTIQRARTR